MTSRFDSCQVAVRAVFGVAAVCSAVRSTKSAKLTDSKVRCLCKDGAVCCEDAVPC